MNASSYWLYALALGLLVPAPQPALAQQAGGDIPPLAERPIAPEPVRDGERMRKGSGNDIERAALANDLIERFRAGYERHGRPRLALYWNRQLGDAVDEWYGHERTVFSGGGNLDMKGDLNVGASAGGEWTIEHQKRVAAAAARGAPGGETWEWEFQNGFVGAMLKANAIVLDRTAINRFTAASDGQRGGARMVEARALQGMADLMVEVLVASSSKSTTGYELNARVLDTRTGQIVAMVNSRNMAGWGAPQDQYLADRHGFSRIYDDEDDDMVEPNDTRERYTADGQGFHRKRKPPKLHKIAERLAYNVMDGLASAWSAEPPGRSAGRTGR